MNINKEELHEIMKELKEGKQERFHELYEKYHKLIYGVSFSILKNKEDSEDVTQSIFTKIYQIEKEKLPEANEASWLYTVAKNKSIDFLRKNKKEVSIDEIYDIMEETDEIKAITEKEYFNSIINKLNETEKQIVTLKIISQMSFREIAKLLNLSIGVVSWKYYQSLHTLKTLIANVCVFVVSIGMIVVGTKQRKQIKEETEELRIQTQLEETKKDIGEKEKTNLSNSSVMQEQEDSTKTIAEEPKNAEQTNNSLLGIAGITIAMITIVGIMVFTKTLWKQLKRKSFSKK